jgi:cell cycle serine/threonine-protein kinase CDC5/MSD2
LLTHIHRRIRDNEYEFPKERAISRAAQHLIQQILAPDPSQRPTLHDIVDHEFFVRGPVPAYIPTSAHDSPPDFRNISRAASDANLRRLRKYALLDVDYSQVPPSTSIPPAALAPSPVNARDAPMTTTSKNITVTIAQQEKEFQKAVQPGSPISALLSSARQPLLMTSPGVGGNGHVRENPLLRKLQAVKESPLGRRAVTRTLDGTIEEKETLGGRRRPGLPSSSQEDGMQEEEQLRSRKKELEAQKARIVAQMAPVREEAEDQDEQGDVDEYAPVVPAKDREIIGKGRYGGALTDRGNAVPPAGKYGSLRVKSGLHTQAQPLQHSTSSKGRTVDKENMQTTGSFSLLQKKRMKY